MTFGISAIVTGAASGLGRATAAKLASRGAGVVIFDLPNSDGASVASELGGKVLFCPGDVTNPQDAQNAAEMAMKEFGSLQGKRLNRVLHRLIVSSIPVRLPMVNRYQSYLPLRHG